MKYIFLALFLLFAVLHLIASFFDNQKYRRMTMPFILKLRRIEPNAPEELVFPHIAALFVSRYVSMASPKKHHTARKNKPFRCEAVFKEQIFVETRQKGE